MKHANHLIHETSPYLLQHAHNPVDWHPWGKEALDKAKKEDKLILVSVGYAACHWCHVMEKESFEDEQVARLMNEHFVCIKVDREERPDIDQIYMEAVQLMTQRGGWPLNCFALPDGRPFYGGTYFPKHQWVSVLKMLVREFRENRKQLEEYAESLTKGIKQADVLPPVKEDTRFTIEVLQNTVGRWRARFDNEWGGTEHPPKFPLPNNYRFLMHYAYLAGDDRLSDFVNFTLKKMAYGGIYDQIGGGFARYSTDRQWKVPHFEKMLYDNAQLVSLYAEAFARYGDPLFRQVVYQTTQFVERELYAGNGIFYSSLDADSEGEEGAYYVWTEAEIDEASGTYAEVMKARYNIGKLALWENGKNVLMRLEDDEKLADDLNMTTNDFHTALAEGNRLLLEYRSKRERPATDDKSLTSWNALMLSGYLDAYTAFGDPHFLDVALKTAAFITETQRKSDGGLWHNFKNGQSGINGFLEDYCFSIEALIQLYSATFDPHWLREAEALTGYVLRHFHDKESGMFYFTSDTDSGLIVRKKEYTDNVIPSSNSSMANALFLLGELLDKPEWKELAATNLKAVLEPMQRYGSGYSNWGILLNRQVFPFYEIAIAGPDACQLAAPLAARYIPNKILLGSEAPSELPLLQEKFHPDKTLIYVCVNKACQMPVDNVEDALKQIR